MAPFAFWAAADLVLGSFPRKGTPAQTHRFIHAFKDSLIKNYGELIVRLDSKMLTVYPTAVNPGTQRRGCARS